jgi:hypothetical protein
MPPWENLPSYPAAIRARGVSLARSNARTVRRRSGRASHAALRTIGAALRFRDRRPAVYSPECVEGAFPEVPIREPE